MSIIDRFHRIDKWMAEAPISLIVLGAFLGTICLMTLMVLAIGAIMR
jgi:hypothetical protein